MYHGVMIYLFFTFVGGLFVGSFLNLVSDRVIRNESILFGRSKCENCKKSLAPKDLVPLLSFILVKGKCRYCKTKLSLYYPLAELVTGLLFVGAAYYTQVFSVMEVPTVVKFLYLLIIGSVYIVLFLTDAKFRLIPDKISFFGVAVVLLFIIANLVYGLWMARSALMGDEFGKYLIQAGFWKNMVVTNLRQFGVLLASSLAIALFFWLLVAITKGRGMGGGDIKLGFLIGLVNGFPYNVAAIFMGFLLGTLYSLFAIFFKKKTVKDTIPFGPFLIAGSVIAFVWGEVLIRWYFGLFG